MGESLQSLRQLYQPIQPSVSSTNTQVHYHEILPHLSLQPYIYCYWELKSKQALLSPFSYRVVSDGCIDIFFDAHRLKQSFIMGFCKNYTEFHLEQEFHYIGIRFLPGAFPLLNNINASELSNRFEPLEIVLPNLARYLVERKEGQGLYEIHDSLNSYFIKETANFGLNIDLRFYNAMQLIISNGGKVQMQKDLDTGISPRQLRRMFQYYIGDSPKSFSQVVRFQKLLFAKPSVQSLKEDKVFYDAGFYDQAHFIKEFKNFYGLTPTEALN